MLLISSSKNMHINNGILYLELVMVAQELVDTRDDLGKFTKEEKNENWDNEHNVDIWHDVTCVSLS
jgi:hypothetical protein